MAIEDTLPDFSTPPLGNELAVLHGVPNENHNLAYDSALTRGPAQFFEKLAAPLNKHVFGPLTEKNRLVGMIAANALLTAPRLLEPQLGQHYIDHLRAGHRVRAAGFLVAKGALKLTDGFDGAVTRENGITSLFGAGFDAGVDMVGTRDDGQRIKEAYQHLGIDDGFTDALIDTRLGLDALVAIVGGVGNTLAAKRAESTGAAIPAHDQPKANTFAKLKFGLSCVADMALLAGTIPKNPETQKTFKKFGTALLVGSVAAGAVSLVKYSQSALRNVQRSHVANQEQQSSINS